MEITVEPNKMYAVTTSGSCTVIDADGLELCTASSGQQSFFVATTSTVTISDDSAKVSRANFKHALAALSLLGGGDNLPAGYTRLAFLGTTGSQYINTGIVATSELCGIVTFSFTEKTWQPLFVASKSGKSWIVFARGTVESRTGVRFDLGSEGIVLSPIVDLSDGAKHTIKKEGANNWVDGVRKQANKSASFDGGDTVKLGCLTAYGYYFQGKIYSASLYTQEQKLRVFIPSISPSGKPCMYDSVSQKAFPGTGTFIAGMTVAQARKLGQLPAGTTLTVSLPVGWQEDEGVVNAIAQATANGCVITQAEDWSNGGSAASSSFALRRVWVRKTQDSNGTYVDSDNTRWLVEHCIDVWGADPETLGYERFRSVDAATDYWELTPFMTIEPETEPETKTEPEN